MSAVTYKKSGVDIESMDGFKRRIRPLVRKSFGPQVLKDIGGFGALFGFNKKDYREPVLVSSADGVGTKIKIAAMLGQHDTVGIDAVAMNVNDILCAGARPLFFLDYVAFSSLPTTVLYDIVKGITKGCLLSGCSLIGGETAQMPGMYSAGDYDIAGFCVGAAEKSSIINGASITYGDIVLGLESSGLHSNGYSLVRKVLSKQQIKDNAAAIIKPTRIYVKQVLPLIRDFHVHGIAHITGGAFYDKIGRITPSNIDILIKKGAWRIPKLFRMIQESGRISDREMFHTLNMGIGMAVILPPSEVKAAVCQLRQNGIRAHVIGEAVKGRSNVEII